MITQIPLSLLPDYVEVRVPVAGEYGGEFSEVAQTITNVRYVGADDIDKRSYSMGDGSKGVLYVDAVNSGGAFAIPVKSRINVNGAPESLTVVKVKPLRQLWGRIHHWEIEVR